MRGRKSTGTKKAANGAGSVGLRLHDGQRGFGAGGTPGGGGHAVTTTPNVGSPLPRLQASCASQQASGSPSVKQCSGHVRR